MTTAIRVGSKENTTTYYIRDGEEETIATETGEININSSDDNPLGIEVEVTFPKDNEPVKIYRYNAGERFGRTYENSESKNLNIEVIWKKDPDYKIEMMFLVTAVLWTAVVLLQSDKNFVKEGEVIFAAMAISSYVPIRQAFFRRSFDKDFNQ